MAGRHRRFRSSIVGIAGTSALQVTPYQFGKN
jgi:hypothetical protein